MPSRTSYLRDRGSTEKHKAVRESAAACLPTWASSLGMANEQAIEPGARAHLEDLEPVITSLAGLRWEVDRNLMDKVAQALRVSKRPILAAFLARWLSAFIRLAGKLDEKAIGEAVGKSSDYEVLLRALEEPDALATLEANDAFAEARLRDLAIRDSLLREEGGTLSADEVAHRLGITRQAVDKRRRAGGLIAIPIGHHRYAYPVWQLGPDGTLKGLREVLAELSLPDPWTQVAFFLGSNVDLNGARPLDELRKGNVEAVRGAAWAMGEQGAS